MTTSAQNLSSRNERANTQSSDALPSVEYDLIRAHVFASLVTLVISALFGILVATKFTFPEFLGSHGWLTCSKPNRTFYRLAAPEGECAPVEARDVRSCNTE